MLVRPVRGKYLKTKFKMDYIVLNDNSREGGRLVELNLAE